MNLDIYKLLDVKIKSIIKIVNEMHELNNINKTFAFDGSLIKSNGDILVYLDYEDDNGVHGTDITITTDEIKSLDSIYNKISNL